jgi:glycosyltransferase involved in cell wall biosynthesis
MRVVHLTASTFYGGPERQMLGLADHLPHEFRTTIISFREGGRCGEFLRTAADRRFDAVALDHDTPHLRSAARELAAVLRGRRSDVLLCHGYKANLLGRAAARRVGIPAIAVSRGWTWENFKVRAYESVDRWHLRFMDHVVCVSEGQAAKVRRCGVPGNKVTVIRNSARIEAFAARERADRDRLLAAFPPACGVSKVVIAAGRLSPEKGFDVLVEAAANVLIDRSVGVVLFGDGEERSKLERRVAEYGIGDRFRMPGFTRELDRLLPWAEVVVLPSFTEGLPNVALEAAAAGVPVVATAVGGTPEVVADGETGYLVPSGDPVALADRLTALLRHEPTRARMGRAARKRMRAEFSFEAQAAAYVRLFESLRPARTPVAA